MTDIDPFETLAGKDYVKGADFTTVGCAVGGVILEGRIEQDRKYDPNNPGKGAPLYWIPKPGKGTTTTPNDSPVTYVATIIQAFEAVEDDDGRRAVHANKPRLRAAQKDAWTAAGASKMQPGGYLWVQHNATVPGKGSSPAKGFTARYWTPAQVANGDVPSDLSAVAAKPDDDPFV